MSDASKARQRRIPGLDLRAKLGSRFVKVHRSPTAKQVALLKLSAPPGLGLGGNHTNHWHTLLASVHPSESRRANWETLRRRNGYKTRREMRELSSKSAA